MPSCVLVQELKECDESGSIFAPSAVSRFSHRLLSAVFNPQQVPLVAWSLLKGYRVLQSRKDDNFSEYERRMLDEGLFGADFLVRIKRPQGSFFESISAPGPKKLAQDREIGNPNWRTQIKKKPTDSTEQIKAATGPYAYQASFRAGGGMAIAALALASTMPQHGDFASADYLRAAEEAFAFLSAHNRELLNDGTPNILDDYCALMAATELYRATHNESYRTAADQRARSLMARLISNGPYHNYWRADNKTRPFFHPSDAGLPVISLLEYSEAAATPAIQEQVKAAAKRSLQFELATTADVNNPFGYARQLVRMGNGTVRTTFFFPHDTEAAPWWQGEDALEDYAWNQLHWILGRNPFNVCLLVGSGHKNPVYMFFNSYKYTNAPRVIVKGITAGLHDEDSIAWDQGYAATGQDSDWRWTEQWLPHDAWYLYAVSLPHE